MYLLTYIEYFFNLQQLALWFKSQAKEKVHFLEIS